jgi:hypothetical protein
MSDFHPFATAVHKRFVELSKQELFVVKTDDLFADYLAAFPEGTNPIYRTNTEHDCSCCKNFIRNLGDVVAIIDGKVETIWDVPGLLSPYKEVAAALHAKVLSSPLDRIFRSKEGKYGNEFNVEQLADGSTKRWNHFHGTVAKRHLSQTPGKLIGEFAAKLQVLRRGLTELTPESVQTVLDLIEAKNLYRGEEHLKAVTEFKKLQDQFAALPDEAAKTIWLFSNADSPVAKLRNHAIGTLLQDLSEGMELEKAVKRFHVVMAPGNYKTPTGLITPAMVTAAMKTLEEQGLQESVKRRLAKITDISVNNVLWVNSSSKALMSNPLQDMLMQVASKTKAKAKAVEDTAETITIEDFLVNVLPGAEDVYVMVKNTHRGNFMTLTTAVDPTSPRLFKWDNHFAWSYAGNIADSDIRAAVQAKGGRVDGAFRFSHQWNHEGRRNASLMDLHVFMPANKTGGKRSEDYGNSDRVGWNNRTHAKTGASQDVDYTAAAPVGYVPVENITFPDLARMPEGDYRCVIHNWRLRSPNEGGFKAEIEFAGQVFEYDYPKPLGNHEWVPVATVTLKNGQFSIQHQLPHGATSQEMWGVNTETFVKVNTILSSPNHWDEKEVGNKHLFFILDGCRTSEPARGIYNEFLRGDLDQHRKVFEVLAKQTKCEPAEGQLSGLGFSSTKKDTVTVSIKSHRGNRRFNVTF